jgi:isochorismate synthase
MTMLATGEQSQFSQTLPHASLALKVSQWLDENKQDAADNPIAFGVIPFHESENVHLIIPETVQISSNLKPDRIAKRSRLGDIRSVQSVPSEDDYKRAVQSAVAQMQSGTVEKVVLARALEVEFENSWSPDQLLLPLIQQNPLAYNFSVPLPDQSHEQWLIGSSPELLVRRHGRSFLANPLAGSRKRSDSDEINRSLTESLLGSDKDLNEHAVVVDAMEQALQSFADNLHVPLIPDVISTPTMLHLSTLIEGTLNDPQTSVLELVAALHPTPAVCGQSLAAAKQFIQLCEPFQRGYFTGLVGWCDARGNGEWAIAIRCGVMHPRGLTSYAGAGVVAQSSPEDELLETANKMRTILQAANVSPSVALSPQSSASVVETLL